MANSSKESNYPIEKRSFIFAVSIIKYAMILKTEKQFEIANQVIRSGTSIGANIREASNGFSKSDFLFKLSIAQKETAETIYWLEIMQEIRVGCEEEALLNEANQILKILRTISLNTKKNQN